MCKALVIFGFACVARETGASRSAWEWRVAWTSTSHSFTRVHTRRRSASPTPTPSRVGPSDRPSRVGRRRFGRSRCLSFPLSALAAPISLFRSCDSCRSEDRSGAHQIAFQIQAATWSGIPRSKRGAKSRSSRGLVHAYVRNLGHPWVQGPQLPIIAISSVWHHLSPF